MPDDLSPRVDLLERLQAQQERLNALLIDVTARLGQEHVLYAQRLSRYEDLLTRLDAARADHAAHMERLDAVLVAIKDLLERGNGH